MRQRSSTSGTSLSTKIEKLLIKPLSESLHLADDMYELRTMARNLLTERSRNSMHVLIKLLKSRNFNNVKDLAI